MRPSSRPAPAPPATSSRSVSTLKGGLSPSPIPQACARAATRSRAKACAGRSPALRARTSRWWSSTARIWPKADAQSLALLGGDALAVLNKTDLLAGPAPAAIAGHAALGVSCLTGAGIEALLETLAGEIARRYPPGGAPALTRARHRHAVVECRDALARAIAGPGGRAARGRTPSRGACARPHHRPGGCGGRARPRLPRLLHRQVGRLALYGRT